MLNYYSIVIHPQHSIIELFKTYKKKHYSIKLEVLESRNSIAHITILEFAATDEELKFAIEKLIKSTQKEICFDALLDTIICSNSSKTILVLPDKAGNEHSKKLLKMFAKKLEAIKTHQMEQYDIIRIFPFSGKSNYNLEQQASFDF